MSSRLRCPLFENEQRTFLCWWNTLSIAMREKPVSTSRMSKREHFKYFSHILGREISANYRTFSIDESWLPLPLPATESKRHIELPRRLEAQEKNMIEEALKASRGRVFGPTGAAAKLGVPRSTLESKIKSLKIDKNRFRTLSEI